MKHADLRKLSSLERKALLEELAAMISEGELNLGEATRILRTVMLGMDRKVFAPFGGKVGLLFPRLEEPPPPNAERLGRRERLRGALVAARRRPRGPRKA